MVHETSTGGVEALRLTALTGTSAVQSSSRLGGSVVQRLGPNLVGLKRPDAYDHCLLSVVNTRSKLWEVVSDRGEEDAPSMRHVSTVSCLPSSSLPLPPSPYYTTSAPPRAIDGTEGGRAGARAEMTGSCLSARPTHQVG